MLIYSKINIIRNEFPAVKDHNTLSDYPIMGY